MAHERRSTEFSRRFRLVITTSRPSLATRPRAPSAAPPRSTPRAGSWATRPPPAGAAMRGRLALDAGPATRPGASQRGLHQHQPAIGAEVEERLLVDRRRQGTTRGDFPDPDLVPARRDHGLAGGGEGDADDRHVVMERTRQRLPVVRLVEADDRAGRGLHDPPIRGEASPSGIVRFRLPVRPAPCIGSGRTRAAAAATRRPSGLNRASRSTSSPRGRITFFGALGVSHLTFGAAA